MNRGGPETNSNGHLGPLNPEIKFPEPELQQLIEDNGVRVGLSTSSWTEMNLLKIEFPIEPAEVPPSCSACSHATTPIHCSSTSGFPNQGLMIEFRHLLSYECENCGEEMYPPDDSQRRIEASILSYVGRNLTGSGLKMKPPSLEEVGRALRLV